MRGGRGAPAAAPAGGAAGAARSQARRGGRALSSAFSARGRGDARGRLPEGVLGLGVCSAPASGAQPALGPPSGALPPA